MRTNGSQVAIETKEGVALRLALLLSVAVVAALVAPAEAASVQKDYSVLHAFTGVDGADSYANLVRDQAGNFYGTTSQGGDFSVCGGLGCGVVFKLDAAGTVTVLHTFTGGADGASPLGGLVLDGAGNLYGTSFEGGDVGYGTVFKIDASGTFSRLYSFTGPDGYAPRAGLIQDISGNLYGTTEGGGNLNTCNGYGCGVVFMLDTTGTESVLHAFGGNPDGASPDGVLVQDKAGNLYGTTFMGGDTTLCSGLGCGVVFKLGATGKFAVLHTFQGSDGANPHAGVVRDKAGSLYGTTVNGGMYGYGTVFKVQGHKETVLHIFSGAPDGRGSFSELVRDKAGNLYGTTAAGGKQDHTCASNGCGTVFEVDKTGKETVLHRFSFKSQAAGGIFPRAGLMLGGQGGLYGTTASGGDVSCNSPTGCGVVFKLSK